MGLPLSAPLANLVMEDLENSIVPNLNFQCIFYKRYVDDIIMAIPRDKILDTINIFNSYDPNLQFTYEIEQNFSISFLDIRVLLTRTGNEIFINWYESR